MQRPRRPRPVDAGSGRGGLVADLLRRGTPTELTVHGASMRPLIRGGDVLLVAPASTVAQGDVAVVARDGRLVAHRVVVASPLRMEGDALDGADLPTRDQELLGRVVAIRRGAREIRLRSPVGRLLSHHSRWLGKLRRALKWARRRRLDPNRLVRPLTSR
jgi:hypothetical protein